MRATRARPRPTSLRTRLAFGFAGIALLTAVVLGAILVVALPPFFTQIEHGFVRSTAAATMTRLQEAGGIGPGNTTAVEAQVAAIAAADRVRIVVTDTTGRVVADSGPPLDSSGLSDQAYGQPVTSPDGRAVGQIEVSGGVRAGANLTAGIMWAWAIAGALAVAVSATLGYFLARRISEPLTELTRVSREMAEGNMAVRAEVAGDAEVRTLAASFNDMADDMEDTFESLRRFVGDAAHEIGTPLTALQADLELAREAPGDASVPDLLDRSIQHAGRVTTLTRDLLALSRMQSVGAVVEEPVDLGVLVSAAADAVASRAEQADIELVVEDLGSGVRVLGDPAALNRAVGNLLDNAIKFTPAGGVVSVALTREGASACLRVADTGRGVAPEDVPHVFERFHRARDAASIPGSGLGLAIVKAIVEAHHGEVTLSSNGPGTRVEMQLPAAD
jgi:two-component system sensor histidine kinase MprB